MSDAPRTYESPPAGSDAAGLEDFVVEIRGGDRIGTVVATVEEDGRRWIVIEQGLHPSSGIVVPRLGMTLSQSIMTR